MPESILSSEPGPDLALPDTRAGKYLLFRLGPGEFGTSIEGVVEVMKMQSITRVPHSPAFVAGVINLRGKVIPVVDLRLTFGFMDEDPTAETCIVIVKVTLASAEQRLGIIVDGVSEVVSLNGGNFLKPEEFHTYSEDGTRDPTPYLLGVARARGKFRLLLDMDEVLNNLDLRHVPIISAAA